MNLIRRKKNIPIPDGYTDYTLICDPPGGFIVIHQVGKPLLRWCKKKRMWERVKDALRPHHNIHCRPCGLHHQGTCKLKVPGCPFNKE